MCDGTCCSNPDLSRRAFLAQTTLAAVAAVLTTACGDGVIGGVGPTVPTLPGDGTLTIRLSDFPALGNVGGIARVDGGVGTPVAAVRTGAASFAALSLVCPHAGTTVNIEGGGFRCPNHDALFHADGTWYGGYVTTNLVLLQTSYDSAQGMLTISTAGAPVPPPPKEKKP